MLMTENFMHSIETQLNSGQSQVVFKLFDNVGNMISAYRKGNDIVQSVQGIFSLAPSELTPIKNLNIAIVTARLELAVNIDTLPPEVMDTGEIVDYPLVRLVRDIWDSFAEANNGTPIVMTDNNKKTYSVTPSYSLMSNGSVEILSSDTGEVMSLATTMSFTVVENGVNSNDISVFINGEDIMYAQATITRNRTADSSVYVDKEKGSAESPASNSTKTVVQQNGIGIDLNIPLLDSAVGEQISDDILSGGNNKAYAVVIKFKTKTRGYVMTTGSNVIGLVPAENLACRVSLVEVAPNIAVFDNNWTFKTFTGSGTYTLQGDFVKGTIVIWGEENNALVFEDDYSGSWDYKYTTAGIHKIYIYEPGEV